MVWELSHTYKVPVNEALAYWIEVLNMFPHKPAITLKVVFDTFKFSTGFLNLTLQ